MLPNYFDQPVAARYDEGDPRFEPGHLDQEVGFLADLAGDGGRALELAIGTGRVALPLAARGVEVAGIDLSAAMVEQLRAKTGGADLEVAIGDFTSTRVAGEFDLVYLVYNTIGNVTTQNAQVATFENAARHLRAGGRFVVETGVPSVRSLSPGQRFRVDDHGEGHHCVDEYDVVTQEMWSHHYTRNDDGTYRRASVPFRYAWPAELDLMARIAGLRLRERWGWWDRRPFDAASTAHVSVWEKQG
jgi:SAM-dependent methyltransferase